MTIEEIIEDVKNDFRRTYRDEIVLENLSIVVDGGEIPRDHPIIPLIYDGGKCPVNDFLGTYDCEKQQIRIFLDSISMVEHVGLTTCEVALTYALYHLIGRWVCHTIRINNEQFDNERFKSIEETFRILTGHMFGYYSCLHDREKKHSFYFFINVLTPEYASFYPFTHLNWKDLPVEDLKIFIEICKKAEVVDQDFISNYFDRVYEESITELGGIHELLFPLLTESQKMKYKSFKIIPKFF